MAATMIGPSRYQASVPISSDICTLVTRLLSHNFNHLIFIVITQPTIYRVIGYFCMAGAYFAVAIDCQFDPVFEARDEATVKTIDRPTF